MDYAGFYFELKRQNHAIDAFTVDGGPALKKSYNKGHFRPIFDKPVVVVVGVFHDAHTPDDFWVKAYMQNNDTGAFDYIEDIPLMK